MASREAIRKRMEEDRIEYILTQFVDIHGAAKVKMVPVTHFDDVLDVGAGFAGGAVWGLGQGPHSHDMLARIDLDSYTPLPWKEGGGPVRQRPLCGRRALPALPPPQSQAGPCRREARGLQLQRGHRAGALPGDSQGRRVHSHLGTPIISTRWRKPATIIKASQE